LYLAATATPMEMRALERVLDPAVRCQRLVTGVGPMETAHVLTSYLCRAETLPQGVLVFGIGGAYCLADASGAAMLDICLAEEEVLADLGICYGDNMEPFKAAELGVRNRFPLDKTLTNQAETALRRQGITSCRGRFLTVQCVSGTRKRGEALAGFFDGLCENMEGAAAARVCAAFSLPCLEVRCVSNLVKDRDRGNWRLKEACAKAGVAAAHILAYLALQMPEDKTP